ncbi:serine hydroxymethyltransferase [Candidatus Zinderia endosymbiont of Aphrophora alni]|uniref:serine hydroxymethyltransferase n=1 Tax=Candidatus Zinderia endosymbiont of Aphrophora alni TaxID=3077951 RepID=UPI0030CD1658
MIKKKIKYIDPKIWQLIKKEEKRQEENIELIASENYISQASMYAQGSKLTNKYAEGYPNKRYYAGCKFVDKIEKLAINRLKKLFGAESANVQPHSGSQANQGVFFSILNAGDLILGMSLNSGGHLTHGMKLNVSGKLFNVISYGLDKNQKIDYEYIEKIVYEKKPKLIIAGASSYSLHIDFSFFSYIAKKNKSYLLVDMSHYAGLVAAGLYPNPIPYADFVTSTTHKSLRGPRGGIILMKSKYKKKINSAIFPGIQGGPLMHIIAAKAVSFKEALSLNFILYQKQVIKNSILLSEILKKRNFKIISKTTKSHLILIDLKNKNITGKEAENILSSVNIICNKNVIPNDKKNARITSGIRLGTLAITTRGFKEKEIIIIGNLIADAILFRKNIFFLKKIKKKVKNLIKFFPIY